MKKFIALFLLTSMLLSLASCGDVSLFGSDDTAQSTNEESDAGSGSTNEDASASSLHPSDANVDGASEVPTKIPDRPNKKPSSSATSKPTDDIADAPTTQAPSYGEPTYEWPTDWPTYEPTYEEPTYEWPTYEWPTDWPTYEPTYEWPTYEWPTDWPTYEPTYEKPTYEWPTYEWPTYEEPTYEWPTYEWPTEMPTYEWPTEEPGEAGTEVYDDTLGLYFRVYSDRVRIIDCDSDITSVSIPSSYAGLPVTEIGECAFSYCPELTQVAIPSSVTGIGSYAFMWCESLVNIDIPNSVTKIGDGAFAWCESLANVSLSNSVTEIGDEAFYGCSSLTQITIPNSVTEIGDEAFYYCSSLTGINIPNGVTSIGEYAFNGCTSLTAITIPSSVSAIGLGAFGYFIESLTVDQDNPYYHMAGNCLIETNTKILILALPDAVIPDDGSVTMIGADAFHNRNSLTSIRVPEGVTHIADRAFCDCASLETVYLPSTLISVGYEAFEYSNNIRTVYYAGTEDMWYDIYFDAWNDEVTEATIYCNGSDTPLNHPEEPSIEEPSIEEPSIEEPSIEEPTYEWPTYEEPTYEWPTYEEPSYEEPSYDEPSIEEPSIEEPSIEEPSIEEPSIEEPSIEEPSDGPEFDLDEYENPVLFYTPEVDGELDDEYLSSYWFRVDQYTHIIPGLEGQYNAYSNSATVYVLWDGEYIYFAIELYDDDLIARNKEYTEWVDSDDDINPYYNDCAEIWFCFEQMEPMSITDVKKVGYDAYGVADGPYSAVSHEVYPEHFDECSAAAMAIKNYAPYDEGGLCDRAVIEFAIPAKMESGAELFGGDVIYFSTQINDIRPATYEDLEEGGFDPYNFEPVEEDGLRSGYTHTYTRANTVFPDWDGLNGYAMGTLTEITPEQVAEHFGW